MDTNTDLLTPRRTPAALELVASGEWNLENASILENLIPNIVTDPPEQVVIDVSEVEIMDTAGAWLLQRTRIDLEKRGVKVSMQGVQQKFTSLLEYTDFREKAAATELPRKNLVVVIVERVGAQSMAVIDLAASFVAFLGQAVAALFSNLIRPRQFRLTSTVYHMEQAGLNAMPIVGLISFLIGVVLAYQGALQLRQFGAELFTVDLIAVSILRELGILLTAIIVAGRSASTFAAQIGAMKVNEEIDAIKTLGLDPMHVLILPRVIALMLTLPLLAFFSDLMGLFGGAVMSWVILGISPELFINRLNDAVGIWSFWTGLIKAPVFAMIIALIGCFEGMKVSGSAESVGQHTTRAVVEAIFLIIVIDALFSIFFGIIGV